MAAPASQPKDSKMELIDANVPSSSILNPESSLINLANKCHLRALGHRFGPALDRIAREHGDIGLVRDGAGEFNLTHKHAQTIVARYEFSVETNQAGMVSMNGARPKSKQRAPDKYLLAECKTADGVQVYGSGTDAISASLAARMHGLLRGKSDLDNGKLDRSNCSDTPTTTPASADAAAALTPESESAPEDHETPAAPVWKRKGPWPPAGPKPYVLIPPLSSVSWGKVKRTAASPPSPARPSTQGTDPHLPELVSPVLVATRPSMTPRKPAKRAKATTPTAPAKPAQHATRRTSASAAKPSPKRHAQPTFAQTIARLEPYVPTVPAELSAADAATPSPFDDQVHGLRQSLLAAEREYERLAAIDGKAMSATGLATNKAGLDAILRMVEFRNHMLRRELRIRLESSVAAAAQFEALGSNEDVSRFLATYVPLFERWRGTLAIMTEVLGAVERGSSGKAAAEGRRVSAGMEGEAGAAVAAASAGVGRDVEGGEGDEQAGASAEGGVAGGLGGDD